MDSSTHPSQDVKKYTVRPFSKSARTDYKDAFRIYLAPAALLLHQLRAGDACYIWIEGSSKHTAVAWAAPEKIQDTVVQTSKMLQVAYGFKLGDKVFISKRQGLVTVADTVFLRDVGPQVNPDGSQLVHKGLTPDDRAGWEWFLEYPLEKAEYVVPGMVFENLECKGEKRSFQIDRISASAILSRSQNIYSPFCLFTKGSHVKLLSDQGTSIESLAAETKHLQIRPEAVGGLAPQVRSLNELFKAFNIGSHCMPRRLGGPGGILLYGPPGTGKSLLLNEVASTGWGKVFNLDTSVVGKFLGESEAAVRKIFSEAKKQEPSIVVIDELDSFAPKRGHSSGGGEPKIVPTLVAELNELSRVKEQGSFSRVLVIAATSRPNDIDQSLRRPGRFESEIEIPIPDAQARTEILKVLLDIPIDMQDELLEGLAGRTHGFVGADLQAVLKKAVAKAMSRSQCCQPLLNNKSEAVSSVNEPLVVAEEPRIPMMKRSFTLTQDDIDATLLEVRPTAMREVYLEPPKVRWTDIGGQEEVKQSLREAVEWPLKHPEIMKELGITATKGLLLYGPPGCSKTLTAQALATEAGLNFIAVKGAELLNMYVGESERAIREVFRKARAASPSIIFFDEIDAIGGTRDSGPNNGLNVLTTLLNELDGIEILKGVTILAATNKPEVLDPALMRPGRLDTILYVGPPNLAARKDILTIKTNKMKVSEDVDMEEFAEMLDGHSGAEIVSICDKAGHAAMKDCLVDGKIKPITREHFQFAITKVDQQITAAVRMKYEQWSIGGTKRL